jgi:DnaJ-class molecular chaperone
VPHPGAAGRGDLWVEAQVRIPAVTDDRGRILLRQLATTLDEAREPSEQRTTAS